MGLINSSTFLTNAENNTAGIIISGVAVHLLQGFVGLNGGSRQGDINYRLGHNGCVLGAPVDVGVYNYTLSVYSTISIEGSMENAGYIIKENNTKSSSAYWFLQQLCQKKQGNVSTFACGENVITYPHLINCGKAPRMYGQVIRLLQSNQAGGDTYGNVDESIINFDLMVKINKML